MAVEDGGYYAIKGFEYQIDKTIIELLNLDNENEYVNIEQIQDIDSSNWVMQVKYKEAAKFVPSAIRRPVTQLIEEYLSNNDKTYYLYCHFGDLNGYDSYFSDLTVVDIDTILGIRKEDFDKNTKDSFFEKFELVNAPEFQDQYLSAIDLILKFDCCNCYEEAVFYYSNIVNYLRKLVVLNPISKLNLRTCSKKEIINFINDNRRKVFDSAYFDFLGKEKYYQKVKNGFIKPNKRQKSLITFEEVEVSQSTSLSKLIIDMVENYYIRATYDVKPLNIVIIDSLIDEVKRSLINNNIRFNDGYENILFNKTMFFEEPIINKVVRGRRATESLAQTSFNLRIISESSFLRIASEFHVNMHYHFGNNLKYDTCADSCIIVSNINTQEIRGLFI